MTGNNEEDARADNEATPLWRTLVYFLLHIPFLMLASIPAAGYVLSINVPTGDSAILDQIFSNAFLVALLKLAFNSVLAPRVANILAKFKYQVGDVSLCGAGNPIVLIHFFQTKGTCTACLVDSHLSVLQLQLLFSSKS